MKVTSLTNLEILNNIKFNILNFKNKELIIFDFDGTLINSIPDLTSGVNKMLLHYNLSPLTIEEVATFIGNGGKTLSKKSFRACNAEQKNI